MKCFLASHPRRLLLADFPNNFRSVFSASSSLPRGGCYWPANFPKPATGNGLGFVEHYCEVLRS